MKLTHLVVEDREGNKTTTICHERSCRTKKRFKFGNIFELILP